MGAARSNAEPEQGKRKRFAALGLYRARAQVWDHSVASPGSWAPASWPAAQPGRAAPSLHTWVQDLLSASPLPPAFSAVRHRSWTLGQFSSPSTWKPPNPTRYYPVKPRPHSPPPPVARRPPRAPSLPPPAPHTAASPNAPFTTIHFSTAPRHLATAAAASGPAQLTPTAHPAAPAAPASPCPQFLLRSSRLPSVPPRPPLPSPFRQAAFRVLISPGH